MFINNNWQNTFTGKLFESVIQVKYHWMLLLIVQFVTYCELRKIKDYKIIKL